MKTKLILLIFILPIILNAQGRPYRIGTTTANFLEIGFGSAGAAMGDAYVSQAQDISSIYWNPAGLAFMEKSEAQFVLQPWIADINTSFAAGGFVVPGIGTFALGLTFVDYGEMDVTDLDNQNGTGEKFSANDYAISLAYGRPITSWFAFGIAGKFVSSQIRHMTASAIAMDLGATVKTQFFSPTGERADGLRIAMSISNYGTRMQYDGIDGLRPQDILPDEDGNNGDVEGQFRFGEWELPLIFRLGLSVSAVKTETSELIVSADALHPNNNAESLNLGGQYIYKDPAFGKFILRAGYRGLFMESETTEYGLTLGAGMERLIMGNIAIKLDYAYRDMGVFGPIGSYSIGFTF